VQRVDRFTRVVKRGDQSLDGSGLGFGDSLLPASIMHGDPSELGRLVGRIDTKEHVRLKIGALLIRTLEPNAFTHDYK